MNATYEVMPKAFNELDFAELAPRFERLRHRIHDGRMNEILHYEVIGVFPTNYSEMMMTFDDGTVSYRYVMRINYSTCINICITPLYPSPKEDVNYVYVEEFINQFLLYMDQVDMFYVDYITERIREHYITDFARATTHKWRMGAFLRKAKNDLESRWLGGLIGSKDQDMLRKPLDSCEVCSIGLDMHYV